MISAPTSRHCYQAERMEMNSGFLRFSWRANRKKDWQLPQFTTEQDGSALSGESCGISNATGANGFLPGGAVLESQETKEGQILRRLISPLKIRTRISVLKLVQVSVNHRQRGCASKYRGAKFKQCVQLYLNIIILNFVSKHSIVSWTSSIDSNKTKIIC